MYTEARKWPFANNIFKDQLQNGYHTFSCASFYVVWTLFLAQITEMTLFLRFDALTHLAALALTSRCLHYSIRVLHYHTYFCIPNLPLFSHWNSYLHSFNITFLLSNITSSNIKKCSISKQHFYLSPSISKDDSCNYGQLLWPVTKIIERHSTCRKIIYSDWDGLLYSWLYYERLSRMQVINVHNKQMVVLLFIKIQYIGIYKRYCCRFKIGTIIIEQWYLCLKILSSTNTEIRVVW